MPRKAFSSIETLKKIIEICTEWKRHIEERTETGIELEEEFEEDDILEVLFEMF